MAKSVLLGNVERRELLAMVIEAEPRGAVKVAKRFGTTPVTLARWIVGLCGPFAIDRAEVARVVAKRTRGGAPVAPFAQ